MGDRRSRSARRMPAAPRRPFAPETGSASPSPPAPHGFWWTDDGRVRQHARGVPHLRAGAHRAADPDLGGDRLLPPGSGADDARLLLPDEGIPGRRHLGILARGLRSIHLRPRPLRRRAAEDRVDLYRHFRALHRPGRGGDAALPRHRLPDGLFHRDAAARDPLDVAVPGHDPLLGEPAHPHGLDEVPHPGQRAAQRGPARPWGSSTSRSPSSTPISPCS